MRRPSWESELAGLVGYASLILAFIAAGAALRPHDVAVSCLAASAVGTAVVVTMHLLPRNIRLTGWGLNLAVVALTGSAAAAAGVGDSRAGWVLVWIGMPAALVGSTAGWPLTLVFTGGALVGLSLLVASLRRRRAAAV